MSRGGNTPDEFSLINDLFAPLAGPEGLGLKDDAALLSPNPGYELVLTKDAVAEGRHYFPDDPPELIARKLLRMNLSDLAAKGARPVGYLLACAWGTNCGLDWISRFSEGLAGDQRHYGIALFGGDTVRTEGPSVFSLTAIGEVKSGQMVRRSGARPGDAIFVTGATGNAALGLQVRRGTLPVKDEADRGVLLEHYLLPDPPYAFGREFGRYASAALDVSDGLIADATHLATASAVTLTIRRADIPLSEAAARVVGDQPDAWPVVAGGGDDYQILFTADPADEASVLRLGSQLETTVTRIGEVLPQSGEAVRFLDENGTMLAVEQGGFRHF